MKFLLLAQFLLSLGGTALLWIGADAEAAISFAAGGGLMFGNLLVMVLFWPLILAKKLFALSVGVIVFKFAILAWIINEIAIGKAIQLGWFSVGMSLIVVSVLATAVRDSIAVDKGS